MVTISKIAGVGFGIWLQSLASIIANGVFNIPLLTAAQFSNVAINAVMSANLFPLFHTSLEDTPLFGTKG